MSGIENVSQNGIKNFCRPNGAYNKLKGWVHQLNIQIQDYREGHRMDRAKLNNMLNMSGIENVSKMVLNTSVDPIEIKIN